MSLHSYYTWYAILCINILLHPAATVKLIMQQMNYELGDGVGKAFATIKHDDEVAAESGSTKK